MKYSSKFPTSAKPTFLHESRKSWHYLSTVSSMKHTYKTYSCCNFLNNAKGFTLIEITVVIILIAIAGSLVLMNIGQSGRMKQSRMFSTQMVSLCKTARMTAITKGIPTCLTISPELRECKINFADDIMYDSVYNTTNEEGSRADTNSLKIPENILLEGENIKVDSNGVYYICFYPDGSSGGGTLTISVENEFEFTFQVDILTGSVKEVIDSNI